MITIISFFLSTRVLVEVSSSFFLFFFGPFQLRGRCSIGLMTDFGLQQLQIAGSLVEPTGIVCAILASWPLFMFAIFFVVTIIVPVVPDPLRLRFCFRKSSGVL